MFQKVSIWFLGLLSWPDPNFCQKWSLENLFQWNFISFINHTMTTRVKFFQEKNLEIFQVVKMPWQNFIFFQNTRFIKWTCLSLLQSFLFQFSFFHTKAWMAQKVELNFNGFLVPFREEVEKTSLWTLSDFILCGAVDFQTQLQITRNGFFLVFFYHSQMWKSRLVRLCL